MKHYGPTLTLYNYTKQKQNEAIKTKNKNKPNKNRNRKDFLVCVILPGANFPVPFQIDRQVEMYASAMICLIL